jgi:ligand-binding sensor protein
MEEKSILFEEAIKENMLENIIDEIEANPNLIYVIIKDGKPYAKIISYKKYENIIPNDAQQD